MFANNLIICNTWKIFLTGKYSFQEKIFFSTEKNFWRSTSSLKDLHLQDLLHHLLRGKNLLSRKRSSFQENIFFPGKDLLNIELEILYFFVFVDHQFWSTILVCSCFGKGSELWCRTLKGSKLRLLELVFIRKGAPVFKWRFYLSLLISGLINPFCVT